MATKAAMNRGAAARVFQFSVSECDLRRFWSMMGYVRQLWSYDLLGQDEIERGGFHEIGPWPAGRSAMRASQVKSEE